MYDDDNVDGDDNDDDIDGVHVDADEFYFPRIITSASTEQLVSSCLIEPVNNYHNYSPDMTSNNYAIIVQQLFTLLFNNRQMLTTESTLGLLYV